MILRLWPILAACLAVASAAAAEPPAGTKNFAPPGGVPNYFSNEAGAPLGSGGIVRPHGSRPSIVGEEENQRPQRAIASNRHHSVRHAAARRDRHGSRHAAVKWKRRPTRFAAAKPKASRTAARSRSDHRAANLQTHDRAKKSEPVKAAQSKPTGTKPKQPAGHAG